MDKQPRFLFFCLDYKGHHMEYVNFQYLHAVHNNINTIFLLNPNCKKHIQLYHWPKSDVVKLEYFKTEEISAYEGNTRLKCAAIACRLLAKYDSIFEPEVIITNNLITFFPHSLFTSIKSKLHGIIYQSPYYCQGTGLKKFIRHYVTPFCLRISKCIGRIWLLNDNFSPDFYNKKFKTQKFCHLADPIDNNNNNVAIRERQEHIRFEHIGGMSERKGTFTILDAIMLMSPEEQSHFVFSFSGRLSMRDEAQFNEYRARLQDANVIEYNPGLIEQDKFNSLINQSDYILVPYKNVENSSGILGHAALHHKPVIGPSEGLLGKLITDYNLGLAISNITPESLKSAIMNVVNFDTNQCQFDRYIADNSVDNFTNEIFRI